LWRLVVFQGLLEKLDDLLSVGIGRKNLQVAGVFNPPDCFGVLRSIEKPFTVVGLHDTIRCSAAAKEYPSEWVLHSTRLFEYRTQINECRRKGKLKKTVLHFPSLYLFFA